MDHSEEERDVDEAPDFVDFPVFLDDATHRRLTAQAARAKKKLADVVALAMTYAVDQADHLVPLAVAQRRCTVRVTGEFAQLLGEMGLVSPEQRGCLAATGAPRVEHHQIRVEAEVARVGEHDDAGLA